MLFVQVFVLLFLLVVISGIATAMVLYDTIATALVKAPSPVINGLTVPTDRAPALLRTLTGHADGRVRCVFAGRAHDRIGSDDNTIKLWDVAGANC